MNKCPDGIRIVAVKGSVRPENYTSKALVLVADEIHKHPEIDFHIVDPAAMTLPLPGMGDGSAETEELQNLVSSATGVISVHT